MCEQGQVFCCKYISFSCFIKEIVKSTEGFTKIGVYVLESKAKCKVEACVSVSRDAYVSSRFVTGIITSSSLLTKLLTASNLSVIQIFVHFSFKYLTVQLYIFLHLLSLSKIIHKKATTTVDACIRLFLFSSDPWYYSIYLF